MSDKAKCYVADVLENFMYYALKSMWYRSICICPKLSSSTLGQNWWGVGGTVCTYLHTVFDHVIVGYMCSRVHSIVFCFVNPAPITINRELINCCIVVQ